MTAHVSKIALAVVFGLLLSAAPALAADVDGKWAGTLATPGGDFPVTFEFKSDGAKLSGTTTGPDGAVLNIKDGKIDGDKIAFGSGVKVRIWPFTLSFETEAKTVLSRGELEAHLRSIVADLELPTLSSAPDLGDG